MPFVTVMKREGARGLVPIETKSGNEITTFLSRSTDLRPVFHRVVKLGRSMVAEEFEKEAFRTAGGGFEAWEKTKPFGTRAAPSKTLQQTGNLRDAWAGKNARGIEDVTRTYATFGVLVPYARVHQKGARIRVTKKMRLFLGMEFGVWLSAEKTEIVIPARRHAELEESIEFARGVAALIEEHITGQQALRQEKAA